MREISLNFFKFFVLLLFSTFFALINGHGRLMEPPNRSSLWRFPQYSKYSPPTNYDDNQLYCGGASVQYMENGGKCGPCGDTFSDARPRDNERGGKYGRQIVARRYSMGQVIPISVELTRSHLGYFEFSLCPLRKSTDLEEEVCFDKYLLQLENGETKFYIKTTEIGFFNTTARLPPQLTCGQCVFRWHYRAGNSWGTCEDGTSGLGCGNQETFRGCSDVIILFNK